MPSDSTPWVSHKDAVASLTTHYLLWESTSKLKLQSQSVSVCVAHTCTDTLWVCLCSSLCPCADEMVVVSTGKGRKQSSVYYQAVYLPQSSTARMTKGASVHVQYVACLYVCSCSERSRAGHRRSTAIWDSAGSTSWFCTDTNNSSLVHFK